MSKHKRPAVTAILRPGEGAGIEVVRRATPRPDGTTAIELSMNLASAPVPERHYLADMASVVYREEFAQLLFGQRRIGSKELRSLVMVSLTPDAVSQFLATCTTFGPVIRAFVERNRWSVPALPELTDEPPQTVSLIANIVAAAYAGGEGCLNFYHISARTVYGMTQTGSTRIPIDPVVRVNLPTVWLVTMLDALEKVRAQLPLEAQA